MIVDVYIVFLFKQKTAYEMRISDWSSDVCSSDLAVEKCLDRLREDFPADRNAQPREAVQSHALKVEHASSSMNVCGFLTGETRCCTCPLLSPVWRCANEPRHGRGRLTPAVARVARGCRSTGPSAPHGTEGRS